ncbi:2-C-methyl-D-erythritol 4-phosphate cytidylyltransferase [Demequina capsici]|uniref:2-C-methyl-D-erythritol 4-phosphate cytidylyltransferase n=1 Tax=Demequina capsici TaxID=3075620 RepID=A0AA96JAY9_9MICO|nr:MULTISPECIES: 2-C-methyl-D-erythritol 4-phosphate cytidylyltransferase [unclassified Demequina]WNM24948.1 2-C-methyl-D-erythritol 4-phosphate cytidylyltransferase [Demequina sp. OYTSA14]WNM27855.1 2-C-methyl-D-erythritol 4-phosphate cytidylyltransferase [Demequina sp. PMTSA13]
MTVAAVVTAAGSGTRLGRDLPKALVTIAGTPLVAWAASSLAAVCEQVVVTAPAEHLEEFRRAVSHVAARVTVVAGGATRQQSVALGLAAVSPEADEILVHDAARAFMPVAVSGRALAALDAADGVIPVLPVVDTIVATSGGEVRYLDRSSLGGVQTPQAFRASALRDAHARAAAGGFEGTDDGSLLAAYGYRVVTCEGDPEGRKITYAEDLDHFERRWARA